MVASTGSARLALLISACAMGGLVAWHGLAPMPAQDGAPRAVIAAAKDHVVRASLFQLPSIGLDELAVPRGGALFDAALEIGPRGGDLDEVEIPELPSDPIRDEGKLGAEGFPVPMREGKGDLLLSRLPPGVEALDAEERLDAAADPFLPEEGSAPLARLSRLLEPPAADAPTTEFRASRLDAALAASMAERMRPAGPETGGADGAVPPDHSLAPTGGTSPAVAEPALGGIDTRTTGDADEPVELAATPDEPHVVVASVRPTPEEDLSGMPELGPDEGLTDAQKKARLAGMPGFDDGVARALELPPVGYTKAQICLATAVYFEARGESETGQIAVAQVVINRVRSPFYPKNVCDVVYQGASNHRYGGCQFSFACDGIRDRITESGPWAEALDIAHRVMDAEAWLPEIGNATHYHANYVRPRWVRDMVVKDRIGKHIFYRVRGWA